ncbi:MAG: SGNH/GDSL hydrolase family protein, partial [Bacteroidales bacterium]|nr:SGNH/GDSL hydrolase family protein [Bacteroidales bacterium]
KSTGAKLIFATTTPVPENVKGIRREPENVVKYNKAAVKIMKKENIEVNDLYSFALPRLTEIQLERNVHFTEKGYKILAGAVAERILYFL